LHEQVNEKAVALSIKATKLTARMLAKAMQAFLKKAREPTAKIGKQSVRSLSKSGASLTSLEVSGDDIGSFKRIARKYNVDFALKRDDSTSPPNWIVFFKAKDSKALESAFNEYSKVTLKDKTRKTPILQRLAKFKELVKTMGAPAKNRNRGEREL